MVWRILRWILASCIFLFLIAGIYFSAVPEQVIIPLDLENESQIEIDDLEYKKLDGKRIIIVFKENGNKGILDRKRLSSGKLFSLIDQVRIQEGDQGKELAVETKTWWPFSIGASILSFVFSAGTWWLLKELY